MFKSIENYHYKLSIINYWALLLFILWIPLNDNFLPVILAFWILTWLLEGNFKNRIDYLPHKQLYIFLLSYFLLTVFALIYSDDLNGGIFNVQEKLSMVFFPIFLAGSNQKVKQNYKIILLTFVLGNIVASLYCLSNAFWNSIVIENGSYQFHYYLIPYYAHHSFWEMVNLRYCHFSYSYLSILKHPSYFSIYILFSIAIIVHFLRKGFIRKKWLKIIGLLLISFFVFMIYLLQSRAGIITLAIMLLLIPLIEIQRKLKKKYFIIVFSFILVFIYIIISNSQIKKSLSGLNEGYKNPEGFSLVKSDIRLQSWYAAVKVIEENFWIGTSPTDLTQKLTEKYNLYGFEIAEKEQLNAHNQYLESFAGLGIFGFLILIFILGYGFVISLKNNQYLLFFLLLILSVNFLFESMLNRMAGILFMMIFMSLLVFANIPEFKIKNSKE